MLPLLAPPALQAPPQGPSEGRPQGHPPMGLPLLHVARQLGLSDSQLQQLQAIETAHRDALEQKMLAFHQAQRALHEGLGRPWTSAADLDALQRAASAKEAELVTEARQANGEAWKVLTADQQAKARVLLSRPPREGRPGRGPGGGGPGMGGPGGREGERPGPPPEGDGPA
ncbi:MAG TPA: Spy/CpxP family protein refolding chaperone [Holophagaceae bacterium]|nr:Spy/CpxP family protein refolding chaperone [Holophagaceae bacterium]